MRETDTPERPTDTFDVQIRSWHYLDRDGGWAVLTAERRLKTRPHERLALHRSKIVLFFSRLVPPQRKPGGPPCLKPNPTKRH
jgi:hypothetical protein